MKKKLSLQLLASSILLGGVIGCSDSDKNDSIKPPINPDQILVEHVSGEWNADIKELPRKATAESSAYISKVFDYLPSNGQFVNELPKYNEGDTAKDIIQRANDALVNNKKGMITLGGFGGYVIFGFDHTVENRPGLRDIRILGNAFQNSSEPGVIMVSYDLNNNGLPDDPWFEIKGSEYDRAIKNYMLTLYNPKHADWEVSDKDFIKWKDNQGESGFISKNTYHKQSYFPEWIDKKELIFRGNKLPNNVIHDGIWKLPAFEFGYADNAINTDDESAIDIDWAIDKNGEFVHLPGVDFVKVYTGQFQDAGILGETSTEIVEAEDLHVLKIEIPTREQEVEIKEISFEHRVGKGLESYPPITRIPTEDSKYHLTKVYEFMPSYGQFTNDLPQWKKGETYQEMVSKVEKSIASSKPGLISLGGFGGYVIAGFDHTVENRKGFRDIRVLGNAFWAAGNPNPEASKRGGSCEPGIIMVSYDVNKNGIPDDEWYEIRGSEYEKTIRNYEISYWKPNENKTPVIDPNLSWATDVEYVKWENNQKETGFKPKNTFHNQSYYPEWIEENKLTFKGSKLPCNAIDESGTGNYWVLYSYDFGYADNAPNNDDESAIDIDWAVNDKGERVHLPGIDFIKIYTGIDGESGWLGEVSTEVSGVIDLHLKGESIPTRVVNF